MQCNTPCACLAEPQHASASVDIGFASWLENTREELPIDARGVCPQRFGRMGDQRPPGSRACWSGPSAVSVSLLTSCNSRCLAGNAVACMWCPPNQLVHPAQECPSFRSVRLAVTCPDVFPYHCVQLPGEQQLDRRSFINVGSPRSVSEPDRDRPQRELVPQWRSAQPVGCPWGVPAAAGQPASQALAAGLPLTRSWRPRSLVWVM